MKAFTLIEVMISLFILLAGMSGVIKLQATSAAITKLSGDLTFAQNLAQTALQKQLSRPVASAASATTCLLGDDNSLTSTKEVEDKGIKYIIDCKITTDKAPMLANKDIGFGTSHAGFVEIKVTWKDILGTQTINDHVIYSYGILTNK
jgi:prepilin-type N-terminal cleavage/methylation domain-containing protein